MAIKIVRTIEAAEQMIKSFGKLVSMDIETTGLYAWSGKVVSIGFGTDNDEWIIPVSATAWVVNTPPGFVAQVLLMVKKAMVGKYMTAHNGKFDALWLLVHYNVQLTIDFDTMLAHHLLDENSLHGIDDLVLTYFGDKSWDVPLAVKNGRAGTFKIHANYLAKDLRYTYRLAKVLVRELYADPGLTTLFQKVTMPLENLLVRAECHGVYIDSHKYSTMDDYLKRRIAEIESKLNTMAPGVMITNRKGKPEPINWGSASQVGKYLFGQLGIKPPIVTPTGKPSTSADALAQIDHPIIPVLESFREAKQQWSFFIEGWRDYLVNSRIHPSFKIHGTVTGRLSCGSPNLQQVPRDPNIRSLITAPPGWVLIESDLSQAELRVAAELSGDPKLLDAYATGKDLHWLTALLEIQAGRGYPQLVEETARGLVEDNVVEPDDFEKDSDFYNIINRMRSGDYDYDECIALMIEVSNGPCEKINPEWKAHRKKAKAINFGYLYGMGHRKFQIFARTNYGLELTEQQSKDSRERFFGNYAVLPDWHERQRNFAHDHGYVRSLAGRVRHLPDAQGHDHWDMKTGAAQRQAINSPVQAFASDWLICAALQMDEEFDQSYFRVIGTVHDAFLAEVRLDKLDFVARRALQIMRKPKILDALGARFKTPMDADLKYGPWGLGKEFEE